MAGAQVVEQLVLNPDGSLKAGPEKVLETPSVIAILGMIMCIQICIGLAIADYWHHLEAAKKLQPDSIGYGHWYFSLIPRIYITAVMTGWIILLLVLAFLVIFLIGPSLSQAYFRDKYADSQQKILGKVENYDLAIDQQIAQNPNARTQRARSRNAWQGSGGDVELQ